MNHREYSGQGLREASVITFLIWKHLLLFVKTNFKKSDFE